MRTKGFCLLAVTWVVLGCGEAVDGNVLASFGKRTAGKEMGIGNSLYGGLSVAMPFQVEERANAVSVALVLKGNATPSGSSKIQVTIDQGSPGSAISSTAERYASEISASEFANYSFDFTSEVTLLPGTTYWIRATKTDGVDASNFVTWAAYDGESSDYSYGSARYLTGIGIWDYSAIGYYRYLDFTVYGP